MTVFLTTVGATLTILLLGSSGLSWLNDATVRAVVARTGKANSDLWLMKPGIFVHEGLHALVGWLFGLKVTSFSLRPDVRQQSAAHVGFAYDRRSWRQRLGVLFAAGAPLWGIGAIELIIGKRAWFAQVSWTALAPAALQPDWPWVLGWLLMTVLLTFGASLSRQDRRNFWVGLPLLALLLSGAFGLLWWLAPLWLISWTKLNTLLALVLLVMAGIAGGVFLIVSSLTRL